MSQERPNTGGIESNLAEARRKIHIADQLVSQTMPLYKEPKVLVVAFDNIHTAVDSAVLAMLDFKGVNYQHMDSNTDFKIECFERFSKDFLLNDNLLHFIKRVYELKAKHEHSKVEFARKSNYVICSDDYTMDVLDEGIIRDYLTKAKQLVFELFLVTKNGRINA